MDMLAISGNQDAPPLAEAEVGESKSTSAADAETGSDSERSPSPPLGPLAAALAKGPQKSKASRAKIAPAAPPPEPPPPAVEEAPKELIVVDENTTELDLNHGRIGKIENLEQLKNLER